VREVAINSDTAGICWHCFRSAKDCGQNVKKIIAVEFFLDFDVHHTLEDIPLFWRETSSHLSEKNPNFHIRNAMPGTRRSLDEQSWGLALRVAGLQVGRVT